MAWAEYILTTCYVVFAQLGFLIVSHESFKRKIAISGAISGPYNLVTLTTLTSFFW
jgi:hypothetical protein